MDIERELADIGALIASAQVIALVRAEVKEALNGKRAMVIGSQYAHNVKNASDYDLVVLHKDGQATSEMITRRIRAKMPDAKIEAFDGLVDSVIGIKHTRRMRG